MVENNKLKERDIIEFYLKKKEHYELTDQFMQEYTQKNGGYIDLYNKIGEENNLKNDDQQVLDKLQNEFESLKDDNRLSWLDQFTYDEIFCKNNLNQRWHLLISWYAYKIILDKYPEINAISKATPLKTIDKNTTFEFGAGDCPELCIWMVEAAMDGKIITQKDLDDLFYQAKKFREKQKNEKGLHWKSFEWWKQENDNYRNKVAKVIKNCITANDMIESN